MSSSELLRVEQLSASWGPDPVLRSVSFTLGRGESLALLGPNGAGKTTLLRCLAGLERPRTGHIFLAGEEVTERPAHRRGLGLVAQEPSLFPHRTVWENVAYGPQVQRLPPEETDRRVGELLDRLGIAALARRYPGELSGGEQQRVALARALAPEPKLVLLDEPFASVDPEFRSELRADFLEILRARGAASVHVTHDREDAMFLGRRMLVLIDGVVQQTGTSEEVFQHPATSRVARFLGYNLIRDRGRLYGVLPRHVRMGPVRPDGPSAVVLSAGSVGEARVLYLRDDAGQRIEVRELDPTAPAPPVGVRVGLGWADAVDLTDPSTSA